MQIADLTQIFVDHVVTSIFYKEEDNWCDISNKKK